MDDADRAHVIDIAMAPSWQRYLILRSRCEVLRRILRCSRREGFESSDCGKLTEFERVRGTVVRSIKENV